ncbi:ABC transporter permease subunit [Cryomorpha ignava]|uniref:ABC transporter permease subunit n=1 Tax=Cryomorpha ignava TaxID=101383 RepID=A0A7K3WVP7_9FLAO|nr:ABC transporter permease [Cryomorpha ignava]NEN25757.1 ABC transporter permease subunit [Cryomorpha ignava]
MLRLVKLEFLKLKTNRAFWILLGIYFVALLLIAFSGGAILQYLENQGVTYRGLSPVILPIYDFEDIWQNLAWLGYFFKIFPALLIIISVTNEFQFKTHRQNIIDGLSRTEFFLSKLSFAIFLALLSALVILIIGLILGFLNASDTSVDAILYNAVFIPAHAYQLLLYFLFTMFLALIIRKSAFTIMVLLIYTLMIEPIAAGILGHFYPLIGSLLPLQAFSSIVAFPFTRYILLETPDYIGLVEFLKATGWGFVFLFGIFWQLKRRDF